MEGNRRTIELGKVTPVIKARGARGDSNWLETGYLLCLLAGADNNNNNVRRKGAGLTEGFEK